MAQFISEINGAKIVSCESRKSKKDREYLQVTVKDSHFNEFSFVDFHVENQGLYIPNTKGKLLIKYSESRYGNTTYKNVEIEDFQPIA